MPIVFSAIVPHPPVLIPAIGKEHLKKIKKTEGAMKALEQELYAAKPETLLIISPHGQILKESFCINLSPDFDGDLKEFGDFSTNLKFKCDYMSIQYIRAADETQSKNPLVLISEPKIDHGSLIPLFYLTQHLKTLPIIPLYYSGLDLNAHYEFGKFIYRQLSRLNKRVAIVASGDLSHRLTKDAPAGFSKRGKEFDEKLIKLISDKKVKEILNLDKKLIKDAAECGLRSIAILLGILAEADYQPEVLSYEGPFGVGYLVANMKFA